MVGLLAQTTQMTTEEASGLMAFLGAYFLVLMIMVVVLVIAMWKIFKKAGKPGWAAIVPIYNIIVLLEVVGRPLWWIILLIIPFVNIIVGIIVILDLAKSFGKTVGFAIGMFLLPFIFYPILGFGSATYMGPAGAAGGMAPPPAPPAPPAPAG